jgi:murein DD-endopeptidase MepM/ murein hydrolase activator NlpD
MKTLRCLIPVVCLLLLGAAADPVEAAPPRLDSDPVGVWPLAPEPEVVNDFDPPDDPWGSGHRGVDLAGAVGQSVLSAMAGTVAFVGKIAGKPVVTISHGETRTTYEPVSSTLEVGVAVASGERIGSLELPFSHCFPGACLHWGWLRGETYLDPLSLVSDGRVRLLPLWRDQPVDHGAPASWRPLPLPYAAWSPPLRPADAPGGRPAAAGPW